MAGWTHKEDPTICCVQKTHFKLDNVGKLKAEDWEK